MFSPINQIYDDGSMLKFIQRTDPGFPGPTGPHKAITIIRSVVGVFNYMQEPEIKQIFVNEKTRIGSVIDGIDKNLAKTPRKVKIGHSNDYRTFAPWQPLSLGKKWDAYMDDVFKVAKDKGTKFVEDNIKRLKEEYSSTKAKNAAKDDPKKDKDERNEIAEWAKLREDAERKIQHLEDAWNKAKDWKRPW
jgi:hypothetical protein